MNTALMSAIASETKVLAEQSERNIEKAFIVDNWSLFSENRWAVKQLYKEASTADEMLMQLNVNARVHKISKEDYTKALIDMENSEVFKTFLDDISQTGSGTSFFVVSKKAIAISNAYILSSRGKFIHKLPSEGKLNDIYYIKVENIGGLQLY